MLRPTPQYPNQHGLVVLALSPTHAVAVHKGATVAGWDWGVPVKASVWRFREATQDDLRSVGLLPAPVETVRVKVDGWYVVQDETDYPQDPTRKVVVVTKEELYRGEIITYSGSHVSTYADRVDKNTVLWRYATPEDA